MAVRLALIAAVAHNGVIGRGGELPWRIPADLKYFKAITMGKPMIMGRRTFESIGKALPGRANIVVTRSADFSADDVEVAGNLDQALEIAVGTGADEVMVIGGGEIYAAALPRADRLYLTEVHIDAAGDVRFPAFDRAQWRELSRDDHAAAGDNPAFSFVTLERTR
ncbi:MAG: dihydrofolate reductase [Alphaproteobacteria bacterium]|nr:dihydrofolate reductase [Alphaproteobacteria bacterium]